MWNKGTIFALTIGFTLPVFASETPSISAGFTLSGERSALKMVLNTINSAKRHIDLAAYSFTSKPIANALISAKKRGVTIRVMADKKSNSRRYTAVTYLANQGISVRLNEKYSIMHNKFIIVDGKTVETGSFNFSAAAAEKNAENVILIDSVPALAKTYETAFNHLWRESQVLAATY